MTDYTLYPINKRDVDWPLYHLVAHFMKVRYKLDHITDGDGQTELFKPLDNDAIQEKRSCSYLWIYPSEDLSASYPKEMFDLDVVVLKCFSPIEHLGGIPIDESIWYEDVPMEYFHYSGTGSNLVLEHVHTKTPSQFPDFIYNGDVFAKTLTELLDLLRRHHLTEIPWYQRLETVHCMLESGANELHILHNAGFYDHNSLWSWLKDYGIRQQEFEEVKEHYLTQLKRYAMFVLNRLDWQYGTSIGENDRENFRGIYQGITNEKMVAFSEEMERRMELWKSKLERPQTNAAIPRRNESATVQVRTELHEDSGKLPEDSGKTNNKRFLLIIGAFTLFVLIVFGLVALLGHQESGAAPVVVGGIVAIVSGAVASAAARSYKHRHPAGFRYIMLYVGILLPFLFGWTGNMLMKALIDEVSPQALMFFVLILMTVVIVASVMLRRKQPDERHMRPYTVAIVVAVMEIIGHFIGGFILFVK